jgi:excisionase family DNA binding protein
MTDRSEWITPGDAAKMLGISTRTLARMAERHDITPVTLPSKHRRYRRTDIERLLQVADRSP